MAKFKVSVVGKDGEKSQEVVEAVDRFAVYRDVRERGERVLEISEESSTSEYLSPSFITALLNPVAMDDKVVLTRNLAAMLEAGLTTSRALSVMERQSKNPYLKSIIGSLIADVKRGSTLSSALAKFPNTFSSLMVSMTRAGEESGKMAESLRVVGTQMERASNLTKKIKGALIYPSIVLIAMVGIGVLMLMFVVPTLTQTFRELGTELPPTTEAIITASEFLSNNTVLALTLMALVVGGFMWAMNTPTGKLISNWVFLRIPVISGLIMETNAARTTRTLASLLSAGVDVVLSISITKDVLDNAFYKKILLEAEGEVTKGGQISATFAKYPTLYPPLVSEMIAVGEETGRLSDLLKETANFYEESVERQTKDLSTIIEPFLMLFIGGAVGFFALSMIAPIYSLSNAI
ncbi:type II secretion system F family protein [Patescibacteria group bacterium]|nr:type II secretion system F family protein [Patescibacteria group bacterium]